MGKNCRLHQACIGARFRAQDFSAFSDPSSPTAPSVSHNELRQYHPGRDRDPEPTLSQFCLMNT